MRAGRLRHRVTIEAPQETQDQFGEPSVVWAPFLTAWAAREDLAGREYFAAGGIQAEVTTRFRLRFVGGITAKMRILSDGTLYDIHSVQDPDGRRRELIVMATRRH